MNLFKKKCIRYPIMNIWDYVPGVLPSARPQNSRVEVVNDVAVEVISGAHLNTEGRQTSGTAAVSVVPAVGHAGQRGRRPGGTRDEIVDVSGSGPSRVTQVSEAPEVRRTARVS